MNIDLGLKPQDLSDDLNQFWALSGQKILAIDENYNEQQGSPVFTVNGKYTTKGWTEWTQGFQYGSAILQYEATGEQHFLDIGRKGTLDRMAPHLTHIGVHDHGFNNISTYGNLLRLMYEGVIPNNDWEAEYYKLALKVSGAVQATRWTKTIDGGGYIYSFNGPHSLFVDTIRSVRILMLSHFMGHSLKGENDASINLFDRGIKHILSTSQYNVYDGKGRDRYDMRGRTAHECIFNVNDGNFRAPNAQQGYSGFTTWTRGLAWAICGFAEELEFIKKVPSEEFGDLISKDKLIELLTVKAKATSDFYIEYAAAKDGIPYWDTGAPNLYKLEDYQSKDSDPFNKYEPIDSTAAAIAAQGMIKLGRATDENIYYQAGLSIASTLFSDKYLALDESHQGLLLHSIYHQPNGWDNVPFGQEIACNESSMWGDYHIRELATLVSRIATGKPDYAFFNCIQSFRNQ